jgi:toxin ParE1/3/4
MPAPGFSAYRLSPAALADLDAIWDHSARNWSVDQADSYIRNLAADMQLLAQNPEMARPRSEIHPPVRLYRSGAHLILYRINGAEIDILRITHSRQNWAALLGS